jgi:hypothetical protein
MIPLAVLRFKGALDLCQVCGMGRCTVIDLVLSPPVRRLCEDGFRRGRTAAGQMKMPE